MSKAQWQNIQTLVDVLRTTTIPQGVGWLNIASNTCTCTRMGARVGMCCLGVACEQVPGISKRAFVTECPSCGGAVTAIEYGSDDTGWSAACLPPMAAEFYGLPAWPDVKVPDDPQYKESGVTYYNDEAKLPFPAIGDAFARTYLGEDI